jgi:hypothetical protein
MEKKPGRPDKYHSDTERPVNASLRIPRDLYEQAERYRHMHALTLTELLLDGLRLRLETPADPRDIILSDDNTVMQELQEMIQTAVQAEIGKLRDFMGSHVSIPGLIATLEAPAGPVSELSHDNNTVLQESVRQITIPPYDETKYVLGKLCPQRHEWDTTGQSLLSIHGHTCKECKNEYKRRKRAEKRQGQPGRQP